MDDLKQYILAEAQKLIEAYPTRHTINLHALLTACVWAGNDFDGEDIGRTLLVILQERDADGGKAESSELEEDYQDLERLLSEHLSGSDIFLPFVFSGIGLMEDGYHEDAVSALLIRKLQEYLAKRTQ